MADITVTAANVKPVGTSRTLQTVRYGETVTQGQPVYLKSADDKYWKADADTSAEAAAIGIVITPGVADDYGVIVTTGQVNMGATLAVGQVYVVSVNAGGVAPYSDLGTGDYVTILGVASTTAILDIGINATGIVKA